jgi:hypothetical protein
MSEQQDELLSLLESEGLSQRQMIRHLKDILDADTSKIIEVDAKGEPRLRKKLMPKNMKAVVEIAKGRVKFCDRVAAVKLLLEVGKMTPSSRPQKVVNDNRRVVVVPQIQARDEAFAGLLPEAEVVDGPEAPSEAA